MTALSWAFVLFAAAPPVAAASPARLATRGAATLLAVGCALVAYTAFAVMAGGASDRLVDYALPLIGGFGFVLTPLSSLFALVTVAVFAVVLPFIAHDSRDYSARRRAAFLALIALTLAAMLGLFAAADIVAFMVCWEVAAFAIWGLIGFETQRDAPVAAGLLTLALSEVGSLAGLAGLLLLALAAGSINLTAIATAAPGLPGGVVITCCVLTFFGFGMKAGIVPLNVWLPPAHGNAPRTMSPILSGATLNLGVFAFLRVDGALAITDARLGLMVLATGAVTALIGIVYALTETDIKRLLAQSSIENLGIVTAGLGAGFAFAATSHAVAAGMALVAGLYHMLNHSTYKTLLFLGAGGIDAATGTHELDRLGGLMKRLPLFGALFLLGTLAIAALPPLNGFASEWLTLESLLRVVEVGPVPMRIVFALSGALLALTAGLAMTCFVMLAGSSLLGIPRSANSAHARRVPLCVTAPMAVLAVVCIGLGLLVTGIIPVLGHLVAPLAGADPTNALVPGFFTPHPQLPADIVSDLNAIGVQVGADVLPLRGLAVLHSEGHATPVVFAMSTALSAAVIIVIILIVWGATRLRRRRTRRAALWDAGLPRIHPEMSYNATAFASPVRELFTRLLRPVVSKHEQHQGVFVTGERYQQRVTHVVERLIIRPARIGSQALANGLAHLHHGAVTAYATYALIGLIAVLMASVLAL